VQSVSAAVHALTGPLQGKPPQQSLLVAHDSPYPEQAVAAH
jgi:hypothetical protein